MKCNIREDEIGEGIDFSGLAIVQSSYIITPSFPWAISLREDLENFDSYPSCDKNLFIEFKYYVGFG